MKPWNRFGLRPAIGLVIDQQQIAMSVVATTPFGRREVASDLQQCDEQPPEAVLARMLEPWIPAAGAKRAKARPWIQIGLPESQVFQATVAITPTNRLYTPQNFFLEAVQSTNLRAEDRTIDLLKLELDKQPLACLSACPRALVADLTEMLNRLGARIAGVEPAPVGLFRAALLHARTPRGSKLSLRFFLGKKQAIGMAVGGAQPLFWHTFDLSPGEETSSILAAYSTLWMLGRHSQIAAPIDTVVVHGRPDLTLSINHESLRQRTGARLIRNPSPDYDLGSAALGVALNNRLTEATGHDLARDFKPTVPIREIFPWAELALQSTLVAGFSLFLVGAAVDVEARFKGVRAEVATFPWLGEQGQGKLDAEKKLLEERIKVIEAFQKTRVDWSTQLETIADDVPETTVITSLTGEGKLEVPGKGSQGKPKKLILQFATPMSENGAMPSEIDQFLTALRDEPAILRHFSDIEVSGLHANTATNSKQKVAVYSVVCLPRTKPVKGGRPK